MEKKYRVLSDVVGSTLLLLRWKDIVMPVSNQGYILQVIRLSSTEKITNESGFEASKPVYFLYGPFNRISDAKQAYFLCQKSLDREKYSSIGFGGIKSIADLKEQRVQDYLRRYGGTEEEANEVAAYDLDAFMRDVEPWDLCRCAE